MREAYRQRDFDSLPLVEPRILLVLLSNIDLQVDVCSQTNEIFTSSNGRYITSHTKMVVIIVVLAVRMEMR